MSSSERMRRVDELLKRELGMIIEKELAGEIEALVTVTRVKTSTDLRHARVLVSIMGSEPARLKAFDKLEELRAEFQSRIASRVTLKFTPVLRFELDTTPEHADRIMSIIDDLDIPEEK